jgi:hypothetical protein
MTAHKNITQSDKFFWHGYVPFYEQFFLNREFLKIAEFGVFKGDSIRWLLERFPLSTVHGADILDYQTSWPVDPRFHFTQLDQSNRSEIKSFLNKENFELIIEDGSHIPEHQVNCLIEGLPKLKNGGIYILEDIQTSLPHHPIHQEKKRLFKKAKPVIKGNALSVLLAIDHYRKINHSITLEIAREISKNSLISTEEVAELNNIIKSIHLYKRTRLPDYCHACKSKNFDFSSYKCLCGQSIFSDADSMSFVIIKN